MASEKAHWSKDFVEHLRTVHFSLAVVALALVITATNTTREEDQAAFTQVQQIAKLTRQWPAVVHAVYEYAMTDSNLKTSWIFPIAIRVPERVSKQREIDDTVSIPDSLLTEMDEWRSSVKVPSQIDNLAEFREFWNLLHKGIGLRLPELPDESSACEQYVRIEYSDGSSDVIDQSTEPDTFEPKFLPPDADPKAVKEEEDREKRAEHSVLPNCEVNSERSAVSSISGPMFKSFDSFDSPDSWDQDHATLRVDTTLPPSRTTSEIRNNAYAVIAGTEIEVHLRTVKINETSLKRIYFNDWKSGSFDEAFPQLNSIMTGISTLDVNDALHRVESQVASAQQEVSVLGFTIPLAQLSRWGAFVLISVQLYLWLHLYEFTTRIDTDAPGFEVAWIGIYRSLPSRLATFVSCALLPVIASALLSKNVVEHPPLKQLVSFAIVASSTVLSILVLERLSKVRGKLNNFEPDEGSEDIIGAGVS